MEAPVRWDCMPRGTPIRAKKKLARGTVNRLYISIAYLLVGMYWRWRMPMYIFSSPMVISSGSFWSKVMVLGVSVMGSTCLSKFMVRVTPSLPVRSVTVPFSIIQAPSVHLAAGVFWIRTTLPLSQSSMVMSFIMPAFSSKVRA